MNNRKIQKGNHEISLIPTRDVIASPELDSGEAIQFFFHSVLISCNLVVSFFMGVAFAEEGNPRLGKVNYGYYCSACHGISGKGDGFNAKYLAKAPRDFTDGVYMSSRPDEKLYEIISEGGLKAGLSNLMPPWGKTLNAWEIMDLIAYLRTLHPKVEVPKPEEKPEEEKPQKPEEEEIF